MNNQEEDKIDRTSLGYKIFSNFLTNKNYEATEDDLRNLVTELKIDLTNAPTLFCQHLAYIVAAYIHSWPGWQFEKDYVAGKFTQQVYFHRFQKHLTRKLNSAIKSHFNKALLSLPEDVHTRLTSDLFHNPLQHANIEIQCPPKLLSTIVFGSVKGNDDDIVLKFHEGLEWTQINTKQLLNWPFIQVVFQSNDLCFSRKQVTHYTRYINLVGVGPNVKPQVTENNIIHAVSDDLQNKRIAYHYDLLQEYIKQYIDMQKNSGNDKELIDDAQIILDEFLADIKDINVNNCIARNTQVIFRLGNIAYIRNKKMCFKGSEDNIGFCEVIEPRIELLLIYFKAQQKLNEATNETTFKSLELEKNRKNCEIDAPIIFYKCLFCSKGLDNKKLMLDHLYKEHMMEHEVRCLECKSTFSVLQLAEKRWKHDCSEPIIIV